MRNGTIKAGFLFTIILIIHANLQIHAELFRRVPVIVNIDFENMPTGSFSTLDLNKVILKSNNEEDRILGKGGKIQSQCLYITGGEDHILEFELVDSAIPIRYISFRGQKLSSKISLNFILEIFKQNDWHEVYSEDSEFTTDRFSDAINISFPYTDIYKFRIRCSSPANGGLLLDDFILLDNSLMEVMEVNTSSIKLPVLIDKPVNGLQKILIDTEGEANPRLLENITIGFDQSNDIAMINSLLVHYTGSNPEFNTGKKIAEINNPEKHQEINLSQALHHGKNYFWVSVSLFDKSNIRSYFYSFIKELRISGVKYAIKEENPRYKHRLGLAIRDHNDDGVHTYRIPGLVTTNNGTLIAVYDVRRNSSTDLQGDIDVGMSRSINGGQSWEKMKIIMDLGMWGDYLKRKMV